MIRNGEIKRIAANSIGTKEFFKTFLKIKTMIVNIIKDDTKKIQHNLCHFSSISNPFFFPKSLYIWGRYFKSSSKFVSSEYYENKNYFFHFYPLIKKFWPNYITKMREFEKLIERLKNYWYLMQK